MGLRGKPVRCPVGRIVFRLLAVIGMAAGLDACAIPPAVTLAKLAADGALLASTGKTSTDHGISAATGRDCATLRVFEGEDVCRDKVVAEPEPLPAAVADDRARLANPPSPGLGGKALEQAFAMRVGDGGETARATGPMPVMLASLPRPVEPSSVRVAKSGTLPAARLASASSRAVAAYPGLIKAPAAPMVPVTRVSLAAPAKAARPPEPERLTLPEAPPAEGTVARLTRLLKSALGFGG